MVILVVMVLISMVSLSVIRSTANLRDLYFPIWYYALAVQILALDRCQMTYARVQEVRWLWPNRRNIEEKRPITVNCSKKKFKYNLCTHYCRKMDLSLCTHYCKEMYGNTWRNVRQTRTTITDSYGIYISTRRRVSSVVQLYRVMSFGRVL